MQGIRSVSSWAYTVYREVCYTHHLHRRPPKAWAVQSLKAILNIAAASVVLQAAPQAVDPAYQLGGKAVLP